MNSSDILKIRLYNQLLAGHSLNDPQEIVAYMGAMQAQAFDMARWGIGVRLPGSTNKDIEEAINQTKIVRTHILRPTWHFVSAEDIHWMIDLSGPRLKPVYKSYGKMSGIDHSVYMQIWPLVENLLMGDNHLTQKEIETHLLERKTVMHEYAVQYALRHAELDGLVCNGRINGYKQTFCLLQERVPKKQSLAREEMLERLARKFFTSHNPATIDDFIWWSGLLASDAKKALSLIQEDFIQEEINGRTFWMKNDIKIPGDEEVSALLLPQFDEMVVSYKNRSEMISDEHYGKVMTKNGLFSPTVMLDGRIIGSWKKVKNDVELSFFEKTNKKTQDRFKPIIRRYKEFLSLK